MAFAIACTIFALGVSSYNASQDALIAESKSLAALSQEQLSRGERLQALRTALSALPKSEEHANRPIVEEAVTALEAALELDAYPPALWHPTFAADLNGEVVSIESNPEGGWVAALDANATISIFDAFTGHMICSIDLREFASNPDAINAWTWTIRASGADRLLVASAAKNCDFVCFDIRKNEVVWDFGPLPIDGLSISRSNLYCTAFTITQEGNSIGQGNLAGVVLNVSDGSIVNVFATDNEGLFIDIDPFGIDKEAIRTLDIFHPSAVSNDGSEALFGAGNFATVFESEGKYAFLEFGNTMLTSLATFDSIVLGATLEMNLEDVAGDHAYSIGAYDLSNPSFNEPLWTADGTFRVTLSGGPYNSYAYFGYAAIHCFGYMDEQPVAICSAGNMLRIFNVENGNEIYSEVFPSSIVSAGTLDLWYEGDYLAIALSNGTLDFRTPFTSLPVTACDTYQCSIPYQIEDAIVGEFEGSIVVATIKPANQPDRLLCYRFDLGYDEPVDYSLDELLAQAHELLEAE